MNKKNILYLIVIIITFLFVFCYQEQTQSNQKQAQNQELPSNWEVKKLNNVANKITDYVASGSFADLNKNVQYLDEPDL